MLKITLVRLTNSYTMISERKTNMMTLLKLLFWPVTLFLLLDKETQKNKITKVKIIRRK